MLFDLKGKRKRFVQVTYVFLAILFGGGLILFGIGGNVQGGLFDALTGGEGGHGGGTQAQEDVVKRYEDQLKRDPKNKQAWLNLVRAEAAVAQTGDNLDEKTGQYTEGGRGALDRVTSAWERYLALDPKKPDANVAPLAVNAYIGLQEIDEAAKIQRIVTEDRPSAVSFFDLARYLYVAGKRKRADRAADEAIRRTPKDERKSVRSQLADLKKQVRDEQKRQEVARRAASRAGPGQDPFGASPSSPTFGQ